jgi:hypothetical protein
VVGVVNHVDQSAGKPAPADSIPTQSEQAAPDPDGVPEFRALFRSIMEREGYVVTASNVDLAVEIGSGTCELLDAGETLEGLFIELFEQGEGDATDAISTAMAVAVVSLCERHEWQLDTLGN